MDLLIKGCQLLGIPLSENQINFFRIYAEELVYWNRQVNLTSIIDYADIQTKHFLDSLSCLLAFPGLLTDNGHLKLPVPSTASKMTVADVGAGAGFPGLPLKIAYPQIKLSLIESVGKKTRFLEHIVERLGLSDVQVITGRAEEIGHQTGQRESYDVVVSRAVADLAVLAELCLPLAKVGGRLIAPKKGAVEPEAQAAKRAIEILGGKLGDTRRIELDSLLDLRYLVVVEKTGLTPPAYPRRPGLPAKRPLGQKP